MNRLHRFEELLRERCAGRRRAALHEHVWPAFLGAYGGLPDGRHPRVLLAEALDELKAEGAVAFPKARSLYDREASPELPQWVELASADAEGDAAFDHRRHPWHPGLAWIADLTQLRQTQMLLAIDGFLKGAGRSAPVVPHRERSLQLFGDEKALDRLMLGNLFASGRLSLDLLRCRRLSPPFLRTVPDGPPERVPPRILVIENHNTWHSFSQWNRTAGQYRAVVYGGGMQFEASVSGIDDLAEELRADEVSYFGDLDPKGLAIPARANTWQRTRGVRPIAPATALYEALLDAGRQATHPATGRDRLSEKHLDWLPESLRPPVRELLASGRRLPQEYIGTEWLASSGAR